MTFPFPTRKSAPVHLDDCGLTAAADLLGDRWKLLIIREVFYGVRRFDDIQNDIGIPRSVLSQRLAALVESGLLLKSSYREEGQRARAEYHFTEKGYDLLLPLAALWQWSETHLARAPSGVTMRKRSTGETLEVGLVPAADRTRRDDIEIDLPVAK